MAKAETVHQLKITIDGIRPPIWRRVLVPSDSTLGGLHHVVQELFGWEDYHLHEFEVDGVRYGTDEGGDWGRPPIDEESVHLVDVAPKGSKFSTPTTSATTGGIGSS